MIHKKRLTITLAASLSVEALSKIVPLLTLYFAQKRLGVTAFGFAQFGIAVIEMAIPFITFGYNNYGSVLLGQMQGQPQAIKALIGRIVCAKLLHFFLVSSALLAFVFYSPAYHEYFQLILALSFMLFLSATELLWLSIGVQKYAYVSLYSAIGKILSLVLIIFYVHSSADAILFAALVFLANAVVNLGTMGYGLMHFGMAMPQWRDIKDLFKASREFAAIAVLMIFLDRIDMFVVEYLFGDHELGFYAAASRLNHA